MQAQVLSHRGDIAEYLGEGLTWIWVMWVLVHGCHLEKNTCIHSHI